MALLAEGVAIREAKLDPRSAILVSARLYLGETLIALGQAGAAHRS